MLGSQEREKRIVELGIQRYRNRVSKSRIRETSAGRRVFENSVGVVADELERWLGEINWKKIGRKASVVPYLRQLPVGVSATIAVRRTLDRLGQRSVQTYSSLAHGVGRALEEEAQLRKFRREGQAHMRKVMLRFGPLGYTVVLRKARESMRILGIDWEPWPREMRVKVGARLLDIILNHTGVFELAYRPITKHGRKVNEALVVLTAEFLEWLRKAHTHHEILTPYHMPLPVPPADWAGPFGGAYHTEFLPNTPVLSLKGSGKKHLDLLGKTEMPEVYSALNKVQNTPWEVNSDIHFMVKHIWEAGIELGGIPSRFEQPLPEWGDWERGSDAHQAWKVEARHVREKNRKDRGMRLYCAKTLFMAEEIGAGPFYFPHHMDFRGRFYPIPYFLQPQGPSFARSLLRFAEGKLITDPEAVKWFKIHGANCYGKDKVSFQDRVKWVDENEGLILQIHQDPLDCQDWTEADKPWEFLAWCLEYGAWKEDPQNFKSKIPVAMDGTTNGLQIFSLLLRDPIGAEATNCVKADKPQDIYQRVADRVIQMLKEKKEPYAGQWLRWLGPEGLPRAAVKRQVMTVPYGCTKHACRNYLLEWFMENSPNMKPHPWPSDFYMPCIWLTDVIWDAIGDIVSGARKAMEWLQAVAMVCVEQDRAPVWTTPTGMAVLQDYRAFKSKTIRTTAGDKVRHISSRFSTKELSPTKSRNGISPNFVHSLDASAMVRTVEKSSSRGVRHFAMIHDSFGTLAADAPILAESLREAYADIFSGNLLEDFKSEVQPQLEPGTELPDPPEQGSLDPNEVLDAPYFFA